MVQPTKAHTVSGAEQRPIEQLGRLRSAVQDQTELGLPIGGTLRTSLRYAAKRISPEDQSFIEDRWGSLTELHQFLVGERDEDTQGVREKIARAKETDVASVIRRENEVLETIDLPHHPDDIPLI